MRFPFDADFFFSLFNLMRLFHEKLLHSNLSSNQALSWDRIQFSNFCPPNRNIVSVFDFCEALVLWVGRAFCAVSDAKWTLEKYKWDILLWVVACIGTSTFCMHPVNYNRIIYNYLVMDDTNRLLLRCDVTAFQFDANSLYWTCCCFCVCRFSKTIFLVRVLFSFEQISTFISIHSSRRNKHRARDDSAVFSIGWIWYPTMHWFDIQGDISWHKFNLRIQIAHPPFSSASMGNNTFLSHSLFSIIFHCKFK